MKKIICFLLMTAVLLCAFVSCGKESASKESSSVVEPTKETDETTDKAFVFAPKREEHENPAYASVKITAGQSEYGIGAKEIDFTVTFESDGNTEGICCQRYLGLEKLTGGVWTPVEFSEKRFADAYLNWESYYEFVVPENGKSFGKTLETKRLYRPLEAGKYRAVLYLEDGSVRYAEFDVK